MQIIIPMAGHSRRFDMAGYKGPKALLKVGEKQMISHVVEMFSPDDVFHFIVNKIQIHSNPNLVNNLKKLVSFCNVIIIEPHEDGPVKSIIEVNNIDPEDEVIICYCDFTVNWDYNSFKRHIFGSDGAIVSFKGFHPASFGDTYYAYMRTNKDEFIELREKQSFTDNRIEEQASAGIYYFKKWKTVKNYGKDLLKHCKKNLCEAYVSLLFNPMQKDGLKILIHEVQNFICLGTPQDFEQYEFWFNYFNKERSFINNYEERNKSITLIPMAGNGQRFKEEGFRTTKPLIMVGKKNMLQRAYECLPKSNLGIFLPRESDYKKHPISKLINKLVKRNVIIPIKKNTKGQAITCLFAKKYLLENKELFIASCDYEHHYNFNKWNEILQDKTIDGAIWTYRMKSGIIKNPSSFAYCQVSNDDKKTVVKIIEKKTISPKPENDPLVTGTFWLRQSKDILYAIETMINEDILVNGEYYVGTSINQLIKKGKKIVIFDVDSWISFGDPFELKIYEYWKDYFEQSTN